jgi:hypothetical protein
VATEPEVVGPRNEKKHLKRIYDRRLEKEFLRRNDRRKNFESGESVGMLLIMGAIAVVAGWRGGIAQVDLEVWQRISLAIMGAVLMVAQHIMRRKFYNHTEAPLTQAKEKMKHVDDSGS